jgi:hypothetical protein
MNLVEILKQESVKCSGKPLLLDNIRTLMNVSREAFDSVLSHLVQSGICVLSMVDGQVMVQYVPSFPVSVGVSSLQTEPVKDVVKSSIRGRPKVSPDMKRVILNHVRLPVWIVEHFKDRGDSGKAFEKALIHFYGLVPPV